jgi:hypothetical protein
MPETSKSRPASRRVKSARRLEFEQGFAQLTPPDRQRVLAAVYALIFGRGRPDDLAQGGHDVRDVF